MGYNVLIPLSSASIYDRVVEIGDSMFKFQIKGVYRDVTDLTWIKVSTKRNNMTNYNTEDVDYFAVYIHQLNSWYFKKNSFTGVIFVSFSKLNNFYECLDLSP